MQALGLGHGFLILRGSRAEPFLVPAPAVVEQALKLSLGGKKVIGQLDVVPYPPQTLAVADKDVGSSVSLLKHDLLPDRGIGVKLVGAPQAQRNDSLALGQYLLQVLRLANPVVEVAQRLEIKPALFRVQSGFLVHAEDRLTNAKWLLDGSRLPLLNADDGLVAPKVKIDAGDGVVELA